MTRLSPILILLCLAAPALAFDRDALARHDWLTAHGLPSDYQVPAPVVTHPPGLSIVPEPAVGLLCLLPLVIRRKGR